MRRRNIPKPAVESCGFPPGTMQAVEVNEGAQTRPISESWIGEDLIAYTQDTWEKQLGRPVSEEEAIEMLVNIKRLAEVMLKINGRRKES